MEGKELGNGTMLSLLQENARRETEEEAHITNITLRHTGLIFQSQENDYPSNHYFQYHIFQGFITPHQIEKSFETFKWIKKHPKGFERWKIDRREMDAVSWYHPKLRLNPRWSKSIVAMYRGSIL